MPSVSSAPFAQTRSPSILMSADRVSSATAFESWGSMPRSAASLVMARYMRPLSMNGSPSAWATRRPTADFPDATPPSIVTIIRPRSPRVHCDRTAQRGDLGLAEDTPVAGFQATKLEGTEADPVERLHFVTDGVEHAADLAMAALADHDPQLGEAGVTASGSDAKDLDLRRGGHAIVELH